MKWLALKIAEKLSALARRLTAYGKSSSAPPVECSNRQGRK